MNIEEIQQDLREFFAILDREVNNDYVKGFHPNKIISSDIVEGMRLNQVLKRLREKSNP